MHCRKIAYKTPTRFRQAATLSAYFLDGCNCFILLSDAKHLHRLLRSMPQHSMSRIVLYHSDLRRKNKAGMSCCGLPVGISVGLIGALGAARLTLGS